MSTIPIRSSLIFFPPSIRTVTPSPPVNNAKLPLCPRYLSISLFIHYQRKDYLYPPYTSLCLPTPHTSLSPKPNERRLYASSLYSYTPLKEKIPLYTYFIPSLYLPTDAPFTLFFLTPHAHPLSAKPTNCTIIPILFLSPIHTLSIRNTPDQDPFPTLPSPSMTRLAPLDT